MKEKSKDYGRECEVGIHFVGITKEQMEHLFKAQSELHKAGVGFDTGYCFPTKTRDWEFDWSLKGAKVTFRRFK